MSAPATTRGSDSPVLRGDVTRCLCGAVHRDEDSTAVHECLVAVTRSPGGGAVAAWTWRGGVLRFDGSGLLLGCWLLVGLGGGVRPRVRPGLPRGVFVRGVVVGLIGLFFVRSRFVGARFRRRYCGGCGPGSGGAGFARSGLGGQINAEVGTSEESP